MLTSTIAILAPIVDISTSLDGLYLATVSEDKSVKIFDVINFDMINMFKIPYTPSCCSWIHEKKALRQLLAVGDKASSLIRIYESNMVDGTPFAEFKCHQSNVILIKRNPVLGIVTSCDSSGMIEVWDSESRAFPEDILSYEFKSDTDLYEFAKCKTIPTSIEYSPDGKYMMLMGQDRKIRIFNVKTGKLYRVYDESLKDKSFQIEGENKMDFLETNRRMAIEKEIENKGDINMINAIYDDSGNFILYCTLDGIKVINLVTNKCSRVLGKAENATRFLHISLYQGRPDEHKVTMNMDVATTDNPTIAKNLMEDPTLFCTAYQKERFYMFHRQNAIEDKQEKLKDRDIFNEKPSKDVQMAALETEEQKLARGAILHTSMGDIQVTLFGDECPKTVENFTGLSKNGYYDNLIFHRVIDKFMIQTGCPIGDGTGGESIWGTEFEDECHRNLRHDRPYTLSMANAGPNTNGSQFFITVVPTVSIFFIFFMIV